MKLSGQKKQQKQKEKNTVIGTAGTFIKGAAKAATSEEGKKQIKGLVSSLKNLRDSFSI